MEGEEELEEDDDEDEVDVEVRCRLNLGGVKSAMPGVTPDVVASALLLLLSPLSFLSLILLPPPSPSAAIRISSASPETSELTGIVEGAGVKAGVDKSVEIFGGTFSSSACESAGDESRCEIQSAPYGDPASSCLTLTGSFSSFTASPVHRAGDRAGEDTAAEDVIGARRGKRESSRAGVDPRASVPMSLSCPLMSSP